MEQGLQVLEKAFSPFMRRGDSLGPNAHEIDWIEAVKTPERIKLLDWLASNAQDFFFELSWFYSLLKQQCTRQSCPTMKGHIEYKWKDRETNHKASISAPEYILLSFGWIELEMSNELKFPSSAARKYPEYFQSKILHTICREMARAYCHIICFHKDHFHDRQTKRRLELSIHYFYYFVRYFTLASKKTLAQLEQSLEEASGIEFTLKIGDTVEGQDVDGIFRKGVIREAEQDRFLVSFSDNGAQEWLTRDKIVLQQQHENSPEKSNEKNKE